MNLSRTGEVGEFLDDNQFASPGGSFNKCGPESIALCFHSVAPGQHNPFTPQDIHRMAHDDYVAFVDPMTGNNPGGGGIDDPTFYKILEHRGMQYRKLPHDWSIIVERLQQGYPVIIGGVREDTIHDAGLNGASPYGWGDKIPLDQLWHIITATGLGSRPDRLKFRDTANFRPGPREYFHESFSYSIATLIVPKWIKRQWRNTWMSTGQQQQAENSWAANTVGARAHTGIYNEWINFYMNGLNFGPPVTNEYETVDWGGNRRILQWFAGGVHYEFDPSSGRGNFFDNRSEVIPRS